MKSGLWVGRVVSTSRSAPRLIQRIRPTWNSPFLSGDWYYVLEARAYEAMQRRISVLEGIALSEKDVRAGRLVSHPEAKKRLSRWLK